MSTEAYIRDPRFEAHGCAVKTTPNVPARWWSGPELPKLFSELNWADSAVLAHHCAFDGFILSHRYGVRPKAWLDTLSMARLIMGNHISVSLDSVRKHYSLPAKFTPYNLFKGKRWHEIHPETQKLIGDGACDEVESIWHLFNLLARDFPSSEYPVVDATIRFFTEPVLRGDVDLLAEIWESEEARKGKMLADLGVDASALQSSKQFADLLVQEGVEPGFKENSKGEMIYAFAKTDDFMRDLQEHENPRVQALVMARLGVKSTQTQTRAETFGYMATRGPMPVYLRYAGAHTTRWSGGDGCNWQNLKRDDPDNPGQASPLRRAIMAPEGYLLAPVDLAQIECRLLCYLAGEYGELDKFRRGEDPYIGPASDFYCRPITKADKPERGTGKQIVLSCGFGCGPPKFQATAKLGIYGPPVYITIEQAERGVRLYRDSHLGVMDYWSTAGRMIARIAGGDPLQWGPMLIRDKRIYGPGGTFLIYDTLEFHVPDTEECEKLQEFKWRGFWRFRTRNGWTDLYHTKLVENVVQWLARIIMTEGMMRIIGRGFKVATTTHDEVVVLIRKDADADKNLQVCIDEMRREPAWLPGIPLNAEGSLSERYSK